MKHLLKQLIIPSFLLLNMNAALAQTQTATQTAPHSAAEPAHVKEVEHDMKQIISCVERRDPITCRNYVTENSKELYNRFIAYGLMDCLPEEGYYVNHEVQENIAQVRIHIKIAKSAFATDLYMRKQGDIWKLDLPDTFKQGMGEHWEKHIAAIEQGYVFMKRYMGDKLNCTAVRQLVGGGENATN